MKKKDYTAATSKAGTLRDMWQELRWMAQYVCRYWASVAVYFLAGIVSVAMGLGSSVTAKYLIDAVTNPSRAVMGIGKAAVLTAAMMLLGILVKAVYNRLAAHVLVRVRNQLRAELFEHILCADWESLQQFRSGDLLNRVNIDASSVASSAITLIPDLLISLLQFVGAFVVILMYDPPMALIALISVPLSAALSRLLVRRMRKYSRRIREIDSEILSYNEDTFRNLQTVKTFDVEEQFSRRMQDMQDDASRTYLDYNRFSVMTSVLMSIVGLITYGCCFGWSVYRLWGGVITYGTMTLFLQMASKMSQAFSGAISAVPTAISATTSAGRMMEIMGIPFEQETVGEQCDRRLSLRLDEVGFAYRGGTSVLQDVSMTVRSGETVAIVGPSGDGKTTLVRLMLDLVSPSSGRVWLSDAETGEEVAVSVRRVCAYVPQGNTLFAGTLAENLRLTRPDATDEQLIEALTNAGAWEFVQALPQGLDSPVGEHGAGFSEGQAQRLAIARALLKEAPILILDEATSALDEVTEQQVLCNLAASGKPRATVFITHRPAALSLCDRVYRIESGRLVQVQNDNRAVEK